MTLKKFREKTPKKQIEKNETLKLIQNDNAQFFEIMTPDGEKSGSFLTNQVTLFLVKIFYWLEALQNCWLLVIAEAYLSGRRRLKKFPAVEMPVFHLHVASFILDG